MLHLRARWYNGETGTFLSRDAVESEPAYQYVRGNPINRVDPSGYQGGPASGTSGGVIVTCFGVAILIPEPFFVEEGVCSLVAAGLIAYTIVASPPVTELIDEWGDVANEAWDNWQEPTPEDTPIPFPVPTPHPPATCTPDNDDSHEVLTVGDGNFGYSNSLYGLHPDWKVTATNYGNGSNSQDYVGGYGNLAQYTNVDATRLDSGRITGKNRYDAVIFNNPAVTTADDRVDGPQTARLISSFRRSAYSILAPGGEIHINVTKSLLQNYPEIYPRLGLPDNKTSTLDNLPRFGQSRYYAPYTPYYSSGEAMQFYRYKQTNVRIMLNFVYR